jgi:hypothetical protein
VLERRITIEAVVNEASPQHVTQKIGLRPIKRNADFLTSVRRRLDQKRVNVISEKNDCVTLDPFGLKRLLYLARRIEQTPDDKKVLSSEAVADHPLSRLSNRIQSPSLNLR